jgi:hypothetical protein
VSADNADGETCFRYTDKSWLGEARVTFKNAKLAIIFADLASKDAVRAAVKLGKAMKKDGKTMLACVKTEGASAKVLAKLRKVCGAVYAVNGDEALISPAMLIRKLCLEEGYINLDTEDVLTYLKEATDVSYTEIKVSGGEDRSVTDGAVNKSADGYIIGVEADENMSLKYIHDTLMTLLEGISSDVPTVWGLDIKPGAECMCVKVITVEKRK